MKQAQYHFHPKQAHPSPSQIEELSHLQAYPLSKPFSRQESFGS